MLIDNVSRINQAVDRRIGMDVIIISVRNKEEELFFKKRLEKTRNLLIKKDAHLVFVADDWSTGGGSGLGTLSAYQKGREILKNEMGIDLDKLIRKKSVAIIHTAGEARRLYPIAAFEGGNRGNIKLPQYLDSNKTIFTLLEAVIRASSLFAPTRKGRLTVFFGDQIIIPAREITEVPKSHIDIAFKPETIASPFEWTQKKMEETGVIFHDPQGIVHYVEKLDGHSFQDFVDKELLDIKSTIGVSLSPCSFSCEFIEALLQEFAKELSEKSWNIKIGHFLFAPLTMSEEAYLSTQKNRSKDQARRHYYRMQDLKKRFTGKYPELAFFGTTNLGKHTYVWDCGTLEGYWRQLLKITKASQEGDGLRMFLGAYEEEKGSGCDFLQKDTGSLIKDCRIKNGKIRNSVLFGVTADYIEVQDAVIIQSSFSSLKGREILCYNVHDDEPLELERGTARVDFSLPKDSKGEEEYLKFLVSLYKDPRVDWFIKKDEAPLSLSELEDRIRKVYAYK